MHHRIPSSSSSHVPEFITHEILALSLFVALEHTLKVAQKLGDARLTEVGRLAQGLGLLILIVRHGRHRVVCIVCLVVEVQRRERECLDPRPLRCVGAREIQLVTKESLSLHPLTFAFRHFANVCAHQYSGRLAQHQSLAILAFAVDLQRGRCEDGRVAIGVEGCVVVFEREDLVDAAFDLVRDVEVGRARGFEGETDEFAAAGWGRGQHRDGSERGGTYAWRASRGARISCRQTWWRSMCE
jgi:hypothetical protein